MYLRGIGGTPCVPGVTKVVRAGRPNVVAAAAEDESDGDGGWFLKGRKRKDTLSVSRPRIDRYLSLSLSLIRLTIAILSTMCRCFRSRC